MSPKQGPSIYRAQDVGFWRDGGVLPPLRLAVALFRAITTGRWGALKTFKIVPSEVPDPVEPTRLNTVPYRVRAAVRGGKIWEGPSRDRPRGRAAAARTLIESLAERGLRGTRLRWDSEDGIFGLAETPLACAWVQLLQDMSEQDGGECEECGEWIRWDKQNPRGKRFCSNTCTVRAHRRKHKGR